MHAFVFVYGQSKFKVGTSPLVRFEIGSTYSENMPAIAAEGEGVVDRGIYAIGSDAAATAPEITSVGVQIAVDYDLFVVRGKDPWPTLIDPPPGVQVDEAMRARVRGAFPTLLDEHLKAFLITQGV